MSVITPTRSPLLVSLNSEWQDQISFTQLEVPALGSRSGAELLDLIQHNPDRTATNEVLLQLLVMQKAGEPTAGRVILQAFLTLAVGYARTSAATRSLWRHSPADAVNTVIGALWEVIDVFADKVDIEHCTNIAGRIRSNLVKTLASFGSHLDTEHSITDDRLEDLGNGDPTNELGVIQEDPTQELITLFTWAIDHNVLTREEIHLLVRIELSDGDPGLAREEAALELGITRGSLNKRVFRIRKKLMTAVCGEVQTQVKYAPRRKSH